MAAQASSHSEERNRLRLQAREQRNQETSQAKKQHTENEPLFGELYKTNKREDALSNKIRMLLGSYEDVGSINPSNTEPLPTPFHGSSHLPPLLHNQNASTSYGFPSQSSDRYGSGSTLPKTELDKLSSQQQPISDLRERSHTTVESSPFLPSKDCQPTGNNKVRNKERLLPKPEPTDGHSATEASKCPVKEEGPLQRVNPLLPQTFASLLSTKQPSSTMTKKPTAYVRPMDGQDQAGSYSPDLKPPPEPLEPLLSPTINHVKSEELLHYLETKTERLVCVEDILRELIHPWPPLLSPLHTFKEDPDLATIVKEVKVVSSGPVQRIDLHSPGIPPVPDLQSSASVVDDIKEESASSSESDGSRSESDGESAAVDSQPPAGCSTTETHAAAVTRGDWQLGNWIGSSQQIPGSDCQGGSRVHEGPRERVPPPGGAGAPSRESRLSPPREHRIGDGSDPERRVESQEGSQEKQSVVQQTGRAPGKIVCPVKSEAEVKSAQIKEVLTDRPKVKTKTHKKSSHAEARKTSKHASLELSKKKLRAEDLTPRCPPEPSPAPPAVKPAQVKSAKAADEPQKTPGSHKDTKKSRHDRKGSQRPSRPPVTLVVKIKLSLLSRPPRAPGPHDEKPPSAKRTSAPEEKDGNEKSQKHSSKKSRTETVDMNVKTKKRKLESKKSAPAVKQESCETVGGLEPKKLKRSHSTLPVAKKESKPHKSDQTKEAPDAHKKKSEKREHVLGEKKQSSSSKTKSGTRRPLLNFGDQQHSAKHYIKEAKKLKHKADAESDRLSKALNYLDAAMYFVESGIAMEQHPQLPLSAYTMFAETVELLKFVVKLKSADDVAWSPSEKDFVVLCLRCQALLQMAMFQQKQKTALNYSKTLADHFSTSAPVKQDPPGTFRGSSTPSPMPAVPSPASSSGSRQSGPGPVAIPESIGQMTIAYVNITTLCLSAHNMWEQAEELARHGSGLLTDLDSVMGRLTLASGVTSVVRYARQGVAWFRLDARKVK